MRTNTKIYHLKYRQHRCKIIFLILAGGIISAVALWKPEYVESVAKAFILILTEL